MEVYRVFSSEEMNMWIPYLSVRLSPEEHTDTGRKEEKIMITVGRRLKTNLLKWDVNRVTCALNKIDRIVALQTEKSNEKLEIFEYFKIPFNSEGYNKLLEILCAVSIALGITSKKNYLNPEDTIRDAREVLEKGFIRGYKKV